MTGCFNICKSINVIYHTNKLKNKKSHDHLNRCRKNFWQKSITICDQKKKKKKKKLKKVGKKKKKKKKKKRNNEKPQANIWTRGASRVCNLHHSSRQRLILNPRSEDRDRNCILKDSHQIHFLWDETGSPYMEYPNVKV